MIFAIGQGLAGRDHNRLAGVDAQRVHVFHVTDGDAVVEAITHHLVFDFFIMMQILLDQHLGSEGQRAADDMAQFVARRCAMPDPWPPSAKPARTITGKPIS